MLGRSIRHHSRSIVVITTIVKRKGRGRESLGSELRFDKRTELNFANKALRSLGADHGDGVGHVLRSQNFAGVFGAASGKTGGHAAGTDGADADAVAAQIFGHA